MIGKVCVITGATAGLGAAIAEGVARLGATVVGVGRDPARCTAARDALRRATEHDAVEFLTADLSSQAEVRRLACAIEERYGRIAVLVNNAGAIFLRRRLSADGIEMTLALNHLGPFLLTRELLGTLAGEAPARVINVASCGHWNAPGMNLGDLQGARGYRGFRAYFQSKLANVLFTYELARRLEGTGITANAFDPGLVATNIGRNNGWAWTVLKGLYDRLQRPHYVSAAEAARAAVFLAASPAVAAVTGKYFVGEEPVPSSPASQDAAAGARLWALSEQLTTSRQPAYAGHTRPDREHAGVRPARGERP